MLISTDSETGVVAYQKEVIELTVKRVCRSVTERGEPCRQSPLTDGDFCFWHDPANEESAAEARRMGGVNRKRERTLQEVYDLDGVDTVEQVQRIIEIALAGALSEPNSLNRSRVLLQAATVAARVLEAADLEKRMQAIEQFMQPRRALEEHKKRGWWRR